MKLIEKIRGILFPAQHPENVTFWGDGYIYVFIFFCATGGCETASYTFPFRHISVLAHSARDGCCFFSLKSVACQLCASMSVIFPAHVPVI